MADQVDSERWTRVRGSASSMGRVRSGGRSKWLLTVVPPAALPHSPPPAVVSGFAQGYGPPSRFLGGILTPLQPSLAAQVALIARDYGLPSVAGICVYLDMPGDRSGQRNDPVKVTDETWTILWSRFFAESGDPPSASPLVGRIEFDIDATRARWYTEWLALQEGGLPICAPSSEHSRLDNTISRTRSPSGPSLSYILPQTPATSSCSSLRDSTSSPPRQLVDQYGPFENGGVRARDLPTFEPRTSTPLADREPSSSPGKPSSRSPTRPISTAKEVDWTEQLNRLRDINEHALLDGVEHPSQLDSIEGTEKLGQLFGSLVDPTLQPAVLEARVPHAPASAEHWGLPDPEVVTRGFAAQRTGSDQPRLPLSLALHSRAASHAYPNLVIYPARATADGSLPLQSDFEPSPASSGPSLVSPASVSAGSDSDAAAELFESYYAPDAEQPVPSEGHRAQPSQVPIPASERMHEQPHQPDLYALRVLSVLPGGNVAGHALPSPTIRGGLPSLAEIPSPYEAVHAVVASALPTSSVITPPIDSEFEDEPCSPPFGGILLRSGFDEGDDSQSDGLGSDSDEEERGVGACQTFDHITANFAMHAAQPAAP